MSRSRTSLASLSRSTTAFDSSPSPKKRSHRPDGKTETPTKRRDREQEDVTASRHHTPSDETLPYEAFSQSSASPYQNIPSHRYSDRTPPSQSHPSPHLRNKSPLRDTASELSYTQPPMEAQLTAPEPTERHSGSPSAKDRQFVVPSTTTDDIASRDNENLPLPAGRSNPAAVELPLAAARSRTSVLEQPLAVEMAVAGEEPLPAARLRSAVVDEPLPLARSRTSIVDEPTAAERGALAQEPLPAARSRNSVLEELFPADRPRTGIVDEPLPAARRSLAGDTILPEKTTVGPGHAPYAAERPSISGAGASVPLPAEQGSTPLHEKDEVQPVDPRSSLNTFDVAMEVSSAGITQSADVSSEHEPMTLAAPIPATRGRHLPASEEQRQSLLDGVEMMDVAVTEAELSADTEALEQQVGKVSANVYNKNGDVSGC